MKFVVIPDTQLRVSQVCLGSTDFGSLITQQEAFALLDEFVTLGGNFIDTANVYANWLPGVRSISEKTIGQWLQARRCREQIVLGTKGAHPELATMHISRLSRADIVQDLTESLDSLQTDYIDLYWLHRDDPAIPVSEIIDVLDEQVTAGKIRYFGASNWTTPRIQAALDYAAGKGINTFVANQPQWSLAVPNMEMNPDKTTVALDEVGVEFHRRTGMALIPYSSQAHGFFSKLDRSGRADISAFDLMFFDNEINMKRMERIRELARRFEAQVNDVVLAYLLCQPFTTIPVIGSKRIAQLRASVRATELSLTPADLTYLEAS